MAVISAKELAAFLGVDSEDDLRETLKPLLGGSGGNPFADLKEFRNEQDAVRNGLQNGEPYLKSNGQVCVVTGRGD